MTDEDNEPSAFDQAWEKLHGDFFIDGDETVEYDVEGAPLAERVFKALAFESLEREGEYQLDWVLEFFTLMRLHNEIISTIDDVKGKENWKNQARLSTADNVLLFFTLSDEIVSGLAGQFLNEKLVSEGRQNSASTEFFTGLKHEEQMGFLYYMGAIDEGLKGELTNIHKTRNKLVHDLRQRHFLLGLDNIESRLHRALHALDSLHECVKGRGVFGEKAF